MNGFGLTSLFLLLLPFTIIESKMFLVSDNIYFDQTEVSNAQWEQFELSLNKKGVDLEAYRMSNVWEIPAFNASYFSNFKDYPVVGVTRLGATEYCKWRSANADLKGNYRLPTKNEFLKAIKEGEQSVKWFKKKIKAEKKNIPVYNLFYENEKPRMTAPTKAFLKNKFGVFNLVGNVSEMVKEEDIVVGGSWRDKNDQKWSSATQTFSGPADWIGFRCVCEVD